jgi:GntR family transcriptional regulator
MRSPSLQIDPASPVPGYRQIVDQLRTLLIEGVLQVGETLPPVRRLALELGLHFNTVAQAYRTLAEEGFLEIKHGRGAVVLDRVAKLPVRDEKHAAVRTLRQRLRELVAERRASGLSQRQIAHELREMLGVLEQ